VRVELVASKSTAGSQHTGWVTELRCCAHLTRLMHVEVQHTHGLDLPPLPEMCNEQLLRPRAKQPQHRHLPSNNPFKVRVKSSLGGAKSSLGDAESSLGDAKGLRRRASSRPPPPPSSQWAIVQLHHTLTLIIAVTWLRGRWVAHRYSVWSEHRSLSKLVMAAPSFCTRPHAPCVVSVWSCVFVCSCCDMCEPSPSKGGAAWWSDSLCGVGSCWQVVVW
jgi:hypothetical protein